MITVEVVAQQMARTRAEARPETRSTVDRLAAHLADRDPDMWAQYQAAVAGVSGLVFAQYEVAAYHQYLPEPTLLWVGNRSFDLSTSGYQRAEQVPIDEGYRLVEESYVELAGRKYAVLLVTPA